MLLIRPLAQTLSLVGIRTQGPKEVTAKWASRESSGLELGDLGSSSSSDLTQLCSLGKNLTPFWACRPLCNKQTG